jgi:hypothetical protein
VPHSCPSTKHRWFRPKFPLLTKSRVATDLGALLLNLDLALFSLSSINHVYLRTDLQEEKVHRRRCLPGRAWRVLVSSLFWFKRWQLLTRTAPESSPRRDTLDVRSESPTPEPRSSSELPTPRKSSVTRDDEFVNSSLWSRSDSSSPRTLWSSTPRRSNSEVYPLSLNVNLSDTSSSVVSPCEGPVTVSSDSSWSPVPRVVRLSFPVNSGPPEPSP